MHVYDKAKWHYAGDFPEELDDEQGFVHTGLFLTWLTKRHLLSDWLENESPDAINSARTGGASPIELYKIWDGVLAEDMLSEEGNAFALKYFDFEKGQYLRDYAQVFDVEDGGLYYIEPTWNNYELIASRCDAAFEKWRVK